MAFILISQFFHPVAPLILLGYLTIYLFMKPENVIKAFCMSTLMVMSNPGISETHPMFSTVKWLMLFAGAISTMYYYFNVPKNRRNFPSILISLFLFFMAATCISAFASYYLSLSIFKLVSFSLGASVALSAFPLCRTNIDWKQWLTTLTFVVAIVSLPLLFHPLGYFRNGRGFQGIMSHPQALGVFLAPVTTLLTTEWFVSTRKLRLLPPLLLLITLIILSQARTAALAIALALLFAIFFIFHFKNRLSSGALATSMGIVILGITIVAAIWSNEFEKVISGFVFKSDRLGFSGSNQELEDAILRSRGNQIDQLLDNISNSPIVGVGFGMDGPHGVHDIRINETLGIPVSAPVESGFLPLAVVSQVGMVGTLFFLIFVIQFYRGVLRTTEPGIIALAFAPLTVNFGEAIYFAVGGLGLYMWIIFGYTYWYHYTARD